MKITELLYPDPSSLTPLKWLLKRHPDKEKENFSRILGCLVHSFFWAVLMSLCLSILFIVRPYDGWEIVHIYDILDPVVHSISTLYFLYFFGYVYVHVDRKGDAVLSGNWHGYRSLGKDQHSKNKRKIFQAVFMLCIFGGVLSMVGEISYEITGTAPFSVLLYGESAFHILVNLIFASFIATFFTSFCFICLTEAWYHSLPMDGEMSQSRGGSDEM